MSLSRELNISNLPATSLILSIMILFLPGCFQEPAMIKSGFDEPVDPEETKIELWNEIPTGLQGSFGTTNIRYHRSHPPLIEGELNHLKLIGWRGEILSAQIVLWSATEISEIEPLIISITDEDGNHLDKNWIKIRPVRYLLTDEFLKGCGYRNADTIPAHLVADMLDTLSIFNLPTRSTRPLWVSVSIPRNLSAGEYTAKISIPSSQEITLQFTLFINVQDWTLPDPAEWSYHLDLWQNPYAVARYHGVETWSDAHLELLRPLLTMLADAGQKCITTSIVDKPWGGQTFDPFESMITWIRNSEGRWEYDYHLFDLYVSLCMDCGITQQINCYSMVPWGNKIRYMDEDSSKFVIREIKPGTPEYEDLWRPFLFDFKAHLMEMGWLNKTTIALDERGLEEMKAMFSFLKQTIPELKVTMAGHYFDEINPAIYDFSYNWRHINENSVKVINERRAKNQITTYYVACGIPHPNNFTFSSPAESTYEGWFAAAMGFDGFLRWAYNSWVEDPVYDSRFRTWPAGDTYFVYPGPRSSIRFEKLIEGIQDYEKILILKQAFDFSDNPELSGTMDELNALLISIRDIREIPSSVIPNMQKGKAFISKLSSQ